MEAKAIAVAIDMRLKAESDRDALRELVGEMANWSEAADLDDYHSEIRTGVCKPNCAGCSNVKLELERGALITKANALLGTEKEASDGE